MKKLTNLLAILSAALSSLLFVKNRAPGGFVLWFPKLLSGALSPITALTGAAAALLGMINRSPLAILAGSFGSIASARYIQKVTSPHAGFEQAFGQDWEAKISPTLRTRLLPQRWTWYLPWTRTGAPGFERDIPFWTVPGSRRKLLFDLWVPPLDVRYSGLALIYAHGSAWVVGDKDMSTRLFFRHLASQGHVVMDIAYRLFPETDMEGMVGDVKRAIAWMKTQGSRFGVDPQRVVVGGGSAGGHLALLAAYAPDDPCLTPDDLRGLDLTVRGVVSIYGPNDLVALYYHMNQNKPSRRLRFSVQIPPEESPLALAMRMLIKDYDRFSLDKLGEPGLFKNLVGGSPDDNLEGYRRFSPVAHVHPGCPPTLLIQGEDDIFIPLDGTRTLYHKLVESGVPVVNVVFPQTDHAFDLVLPAVSPPAQSALYDIDRFLALMASPA